MTYLPSLIRKIEDFCRLSEDFRTINRFAAPNPWDDPNFGMESGEASEEDGEDNQTVSIPYFDDLMNVSHQVEDPGLAQQLRVLAELYRYTISMGGGYATIARAITNLKNMYSDGSDSNIEFILNGMMKELSKAAGGVAALSGRDNPSFIEKLSQLKSDIENRERAEQSGALDAYNEQIGSPGATGETAEELSEAGLTPEEAEIINPAALGFDNKDDPKTNKGWHTVGNGRPYKNWKEYYENEVASYEADRAVETNTDIKNVLTKLIGLLPNISQLTEAALKLTGELKVVPSEAGEAKKQAILTKLNALKGERRLLRNSIRTSQLKKEKQKLSEELAATRDPREQELLKQKIALNELTTSNDVYKGDERNRRLALISAMSGGNYPGPQTYQDLLEKIKEASKKRVSKVAYDAKQSTERALMHGKISNEIDLKKAVLEGKITNKQFEDAMRWIEKAKQQGKSTEIIPREKGRKGGGTKGAPINMFDTEQATFPGLVQKFGDKINTSAHVARLNVTQIVVDKKKVHNELKPFVDTVSKAIQKKDAAAKLTAIKALKQEMKNRMDKAPAIKALSRNIKWLPFFHKVKADLETIAGWQTEQGWDLNENKTMFIKNLINNGGKIANDYRNYYPETGPRRPNQLDISFDNTVAYMDAVLYQLSKRTGVQV